MEKCLFLKFKKKISFSNFRRALDQRATEPRVATPQATSCGQPVKELHLKEIKSKPETKPLLQSLRESLEHIKKSTIRDRSQTRQNNNSGFLEKITRITHGGKNRNPAKKSASFTFAVRPEIAMRCPERYASLESEANSLLPNGGSSSSSARHQVQRSVSTSVLEVQSQSSDLDPPYSKVRDSLTPQPRTPPTTKPEAIYAEICEDSRYLKIPSPSSIGGKKDQGYVKLASEISDLPCSLDDEEGIYNTVC